MSLVRFSYGESPILDLQLKVRHAYDLHQLLQVEEYARFFQSEDFTDMLLKVGQDDFVSYKSNNEWLRFHPNESLVFSDLENTWEQLRSVYNNQFSAMVFGADIPAANQILETLHHIKKRLENISWKLDVIR